MIISQLILTAFLGFSLGILAVLQIKAIKDTIKDARLLTKTLTTNQNLKGQYGEDCLEAILKTCYPDENINYIKQYVSKNVYEKEIKPDYIVNLPNNKVIIIDCKLNIDKYLDYTKNANQKNKSEFIKDLNTTINNLSNKKYETAKEINQPDFILMYIPLEPIITLIYTDKDFLSVIRNANNKNIIIVGNSSILTVIRLTKLIWAQDTQNRNIENLVNSAQEIYKIAADQSNMLYNLKEVLEENNKKFNIEYEKIKSSHFYTLIENIKKYGIEAISDKRKFAKPANINNDFINNEYL